MDNIKVFMPSSDGNIILMYNGEEIRGMFIDEPYPINLLRDVGYDVRHLPKDAVITMDYILSELLKNKEGLVLHHYYCEKWTAECIAEVLYIDVGRVQQIIHAGRRRLIRGKKWREIMAIGLGEIIKKRFEELDDEDNYQGDSAIE